MVPDQALQFGDQLTVSAHTQVGLDTVLHRDQPQLTQTVGLGRAQLAVQEFLEGLAPPQPQRLLQQRRRGHGLPVRERTSRLGGQFLEPGRVQRVGRHP